MKGRGEWRRGRSAAPGTSEGTKWRMMGKENGKRVDEGVKGGGRGIGRAHDNK